MLTIANDKPKPKIKRTYTHLLYVEDNPANLMLVEDIIARRNDISLLTAKDGKQGIKMARATLPRLDSNGY